MQVQAHPLMGGQSYERFCDFCPFIRNRGGGITSVNATELREICEDSNSHCSISSTYPTITNHGDFISKHTNSSYTDGIYFEKGGNNIDLFINYGTITTYYNETITTNTFTFTDGPGFKALINYGTLSGGVNANTSSIHITNYGKMGGASTRGSITVANYGEINLLNGNGKKYHFKDIQSLTLQNYAMRINADSAKFNGFDGNLEDNSHLVLDSVKSVSFADKNSKVILDFGNGFELGKGYSLSKLVVDTSGNNKLNVGFDRLTTRTSLYKLTKSGDYFIASIDAPNSEIGILHKSNVRTMNNFWTLSNSMIYLRKSQNLTRKNPSLRADSAIPLKSYESFSYRNESINRRIQRQNKRNYNRRLPNQSNSSQNLNTDSANKTNQNISSLRAREYERGNPKNQNTSQTQTFSQNLTQSDKYYFILTPFINHNLFFESGRYNLSGLEYGFLTAFSGKLTHSNSLGAHFMMSYGTLSDSKDKDLSIKSLNLNVGLNYKLDLIYDMYLKARGDFYYFSNTLDSLTIKNIKPNNLGFGASVIFGKDFNFGKGGVLGLEAGIDYKALQSSTISLQNNATKTISETYKKSLYNIIYVDLGVNYSKYFGNFGLNATLGIKGNITANKLATSKIHISTFNKSVDMVLDNDNFLGYANLGVSYVMNTKNFDMEFSLAYYGNYGDRIISNGGGVEWRVVW